MSQTPDLLVPVSKSTALDEVKRCEALLAMAREAVKQINRGAMIRCCKCKKAEPISTQTYIQTHWYTSPHGCNGGDHWNQGEANWICPNCGFKNRFDDRKDSSHVGGFYRPEIVALKPLFAAVKDTY